MDYHIIDYIIRKKNYSLWRSCKNKFNLIKNEHGTYGEYNDFVIKIEICDNSNSILGVDVVSNHKEYEIQIKQIIDKIFVSGNTQFDDFCFAIYDADAEFS